MTPTHPSIPTATYRLQFHKDFTFYNGAALADYLSQLGISHVYSSPIFRATPGSLHGYDICDHNQINPELGTHEEFTAMTQLLQQRGISLILDFVPNHMGIVERYNRWWMDVLEHGPASPYAPYFDIDWHPLKRGLENKVLLPILGDQYGRELEAGHLRLSFEESTFKIHYYDNELPVEPRSTRPILADALELSKNELDAEWTNEFESIITALEHLPASTETRPEKIFERRREQAIIKRRIKTLCETQTAVRNAIERRVVEIQSPGEERAYDALDRMLNAQNYRLCYWRVAGEEINYRRFFDINSLAAIRMELPEVFDETHRLLFELIKEGSVAGVRIDHVDGLYDPKHYFDLLQRRYAAALDLPEDGHGLYLLIEKILASEEHLRTDWAVHGTTGYEFANQVISILVDQSSQKAMTEAYERFTDKSQRFPDIVYQSKLLVMRSAMAGEVNVLGHMLNRLSETNRWYRDFTLNALVAAVREVIACFPVYRSYLTPDTPPSEQDQRVILRALDLARRRNPAMERTVFDFVREVLLPTPGNPHAVADKPRRKFVMKFQQCSGPITAKGVEDTAFYIYNRLTALNEVGGEPGKFGMSIEQFHAEQAARREDFPFSLLATSSHDTKRGEDVRARIAVLSEIPQEWSRAARRWHMANRKFKHLIDGESAPDTNEAYLLYQTLVGSWPLKPMTDEMRADYIHRIQQYMEKAVREAKVNSSWIEPNQEWDEAVREFIATILTPKRTNRFLTSLETFANRIAPHGAVNSLSQTVLKCTVPGVPDFYQGNEIWDLSLVDPDNRRPVDYALRKQLLASLTGKTAPTELLKHWKDGRIKLFVTQKLLAFRRDYPALFAEGDYKPLEITGERADCCVAFVRSYESQRLLVAVPRNTCKLGFPPLGPCWEDTAITASGMWRNLFTGEFLAGATLPVCQVLSKFPVAVLVAT